MSKVLPLVASTSVPGSNVRSLSRWSFSATASRKAFSPRLSGYAVRPFRKARSQASTICGGVGKSGSPRMSETRVLPCAWHSRISVKMAFTAVGWSAATRPDRVTAEASTTREYQSGEQGTTCNNGSVLTKNQVPTPALLVDLDALEANLTRMAERVKQSGKKLRPHAKAHKCVEIAKRQIGAGATGISVATLGEAELMSKAGIPGLLLTSPVADPLKIARIVQTDAMV